MGYWINIDFATPNTAGKLHSKFAPHISHLPERMGLFTLIVLGESIVGIVTGMTEQVWDVYSVIENTKLISLLKINYSNMEKFSLS
ncbi:MAG: low temperature requirement protein A [Nitrososphaeraceae archaeon]